MTTYRHFISLLLVLASFDVSGLAKIDQLVDGLNLFEQRGTVSVSAKNKKGLVVVFLSAKCPCSDSHLVELKKLYKELTDFSFVAIHSNFDEDIATARTYFRKAGLPFAVIQDSAQTLADRFKALKTPHAFVVSPQGEILYQGGVSDSSEFSKSERRFLREALEEINQNKPVSAPRGRTLGCAILRR